MTTAARPVFLPKDFKLLRRPCKRYPPETAASRAKAEAHTPGQIDNEHQATYIQGIGAAIGNGCYRTLPHRTSSSY